MTDASLDGAIDVLLKEGVKADDNIKTMLPLYKKAKTEFENMADLICKYRKLVDHNSSTSILHSNER